jgi:adenine-specific DNA-methyltransferase
MNLATHPLPLPPQSTRRMRKRRKVSPNLATAANVVTSAYIAANATNDTNDGEGDIEVRRLALLHSLNGEKTLVQRNVLGQFATPPALAKQLAQLALLHLEAPRSPTTPLRALEPGFGSGVFTSQLAQLCAATSRPLDVRAFEVDATFATAFGEFWRATAKRTPLVATDATVVRRKRRALNFTLCEQDFTAATPPATDAHKFDVCVANPPYSRHHHLTREHKQRLQRDVEAIVGGGARSSQLAGLHVHFTILAHRWMRQGGVGVWLLPAEFLNVNYGTILKQYLLTCVTLVRMHRFDDTDAQFDDALVSSIVLVVRYDRPPAPTAAASAAAAAAATDTDTIRLTRGGTLLLPHASTLVPRRLFDAAQKWCPLFSSDMTPSPSIGAAVLASASASASASAVGILGDYFTVKRGIATGCNGFFVLSADDVCTHKIPAQFLLPVVPAPRDLRAVTHLDRGPDGFPSNVARRAIFSSTMPPADVQRLHPHVWAFLLDGERRGIHQRYLCSKRTPWYSQTRREPAHFLINYMGRRRAAGARAGAGAGAGAGATGTAAAETETETETSVFRFVSNESDAIALNSHLMIYLKKSYADALETYAPARRRATLDQLRAGLEAIGARAMIDGGRVYAGGLHKLEPKEFLHLPAPTIAPLVRQLFPNC